MPLLSKERFQAASQRALSVLAERTPMRPELLFNFNGGVNLNAPYTLLPNQMTVADNLILDDNNILRRRKGYTQWGTTQPAVTSVERSLFQYRKADGTNILLAGGGTKISRDNGAASAWTLLATLGATPVYPMWTTFADKAYYVDSANNLQEYDGTTWAAAAGIPADVQPPSFAVPYQGRLWIGKGDRVRYCAVSDPTTWPTNNFLDVNLNDGDTLNRGFVLQNQLFLAKRRRMYPVLGDSELTYAVIPLIRPGVLAPASVVVVDDHAYFVSDDGVYATEGVRAWNVSKDLDPVFSRTTTLIDFANIRKATAAFYPLFQQLWINFRGSSALNLDWQTYVGHLALRREDGQVPWTRFKSFEMRGIADVVLSDNSIELFTFGESGRDEVYRQNDGTTDDGTAITWTLETRNFLYDDPFHLKLPSYLDLLLEDIASGTMTAQGIYDHGRISAPTVAVTLDGSTSPHKRRVSMTEQGEAVRLKLTGSTDFGFHGLLLPARPTQGAL